MAPEGTGTQKGFTSIRTRFIVEGLSPNSSPNGGTMVALRPEWDEAIRHEPQLIEKNSTMKPLLRIDVHNAEVASFFEVGKPVYLEFSKA